MDIDKYGPQISEDRLTRMDRGRGAHGGWESVQAEVERKERPALIAFFTAPDGYGSLPEVDESKLRSWAWRRSNPEAGWPVPAICLGKCDPASSSAPNALRSWINKYLDGAVDLRGLALVRDHRDGNPVVVIYRKRVAGRTISSAQI